MSREPFYPVQVFWSDEDGGYIAIVPDLPGCSAFGETAEEAIQESEAAIEAWLEAARKAGNKLPEPSKLPLHKKHSGKFLLRVPQTLHGRLAIAAEGEGVSLNQFVTFLLTDGLARREADLSDTSLEKRYAGTAANIAELACFNRTTDLGLVRSNATMPFGYYRLENTTSAKALVECLNWLPSPASSVEILEFDDDTFEQPNFVIASTGSLVRRATSG